MKGLKVDIFEKDGFETEEGRLIAIEEGGIFVVKCGKKIYRIPRPKISLTSRGNSLEKYLQPSYFGDIY